MKVRFPILAAAALMTVFALPGAVHAASTGDLVKVAGNAAVYYVGSDGKRYVFPNSQTYFTWYADFSAVKTIGQAELAALVIGGNVTYKPGTRLVKIVSDPKVYAVDAGGTLRPIASEAAAAALYGANWNASVDDLSDAFFVNYRLGTVISGAADFSPAAATAKATSIAMDRGSSPALAAVPTQPTWKVSPPDSSYVAIGGESTLFKLSLATPSAVVIRKITVRLDATTDDTSVKDRPVDDDKGGLVYGNNSQANLANVRLVNAAGAEIFGRKQLALDVSQDQSQTVTFTGAYPVAAGETLALSLRADVNDVLPEREGFRATLLASGIELSDASTGAAAAFLPATDQSGPALTAQKASLQVLASSVPGNKTYVRGTKDAAIAGFGIKASAVEANTVTRIALLGYMDAESNGSFLPGGDADSGAETRVNELLPRVSLYDAAGTKLAGPIDVTLDGQVAFAGLSVRIPAGTTALFTVRGDISKDVNLENQPNRVTFDVTDAANDVSAVNDAGAKVNGEGKNPNGGTKAFLYATVKKNGKADFTWSGSGGPTVGGRESSLGTFSVEPKDDSFTLATVTFIRTGTSAAPSGTATLVLPSGASPASISGTFVGNTLTFSGLSVPLPVDKRTDFQLRFKPGATGGGTTYGETIKVKLATGPLRIVSDSDGRSYTEADLGSADFVLKSNTESTMSVRNSDLVVERAAQPPNSSVLYRDLPATVLGFTLRAGAEGGVRIKKLTFKIAPNDAGRTGAGNDSLERWANLNGDFADDDAVADLALIAPDKTRTVLGEGAGTRITYTIVHGGARSSASSAVVSQAGDYALLEYLFDDGNEISIGAGGAPIFHFDLDVTQLDSTNDWGLQVQLLGGADLLWTDIPYGAYAALTDSRGAPVVSSLTIKK